MRVWYRLYRTTSLRDWFSEVISFHGLKAAVGNTAEPPVRHFYIITLPRLSAAYMPYRDFFVC